MKLSKSRRGFLAGATGVIAGLHDVFHSVHASEKAPVRVAWISPQTGILAAFGHTDRYAHQKLSPLLREGLNLSSGEKRSIEVTLHDNASSPARAQELARELIASGQHLILATATPDLCNPVSDVCEAEGVPCISSIVPWQAWYRARGGRRDKPFEWTYHFFAGLEDFADVYGSLISRAKLGEKVGGLFGNDIDGDAFFSAFQPAFAQRGLELSVPKKRVSLSSASWEGEAERLRDANVRVVTGVLPPPVAKAFFDAAQKVGYKPQMASIAKAFVFPELVGQIHQSGLTLTNEVWWSPAWPFKSALTGMTPERLVQSYEAETGRQWVQTLGFSHALMEVAAEFCRSASAPSRAAIREAIRRGSAKTVVGPISWRDPHPNHNVCTTPAVGGQWIRGAQGRWVLEVVDNSRSPFIPTTASLKTA